MKPTKAKLITGDFEDNTLTFEVEELKEVKAGEYVIMSAHIFEALIDPKPMQPR